MFDSLQPHGLQCANLSFTTSWRWWQASDTEQGLLFHTMVFLFPGPNALLILSKIILDPFLQNNVFFSLRKPLSPLSALSHCSACYFNEVFKLHLLVIVKAVVFPVHMYWCEAWFIKKAKHCRIDTFWLWCWRRLLRVPWITRRLNQSILKEINPEYSLEGHAEAETRIFWPPDVKSQLTGKDPDVGKDWGQEEKGSNRGYYWMASLT